MDINAYMDKLKNQGLKLTGQRKRILEILLEQDRYLSARELIDLLSPDYPSISFDTIYRNLRTMRDEQILEEAMFDDGSSRFRIACIDEDQNHHHHHHFICMGCGSTQTLEACPMEEIKEVPEGFEVAYHRFEIFGLCQACKQAAGSSSV